MTDLTHKRYHRPEGFSLASVHGNEEHHIHNHGDLMPLEGFVALVMPENRDLGTYAPTRAYFGVSSPLGFNPGDEILVDLENGFSQLTHVKRRTGRMVEVTPWLDVPPSLPSPLGGGEVHKIIGRKSTQIDTRFDLDTQKGRDHWEQQQRIQEEYKMLVKEGLVREGLQDKKQPGTWG